MSGHGPNDFKHEPIKHEAPKPDYWQRERKRVHRLSKVFRALGWLATILFALFVLWRMTRPND